MLFGLSLFLTKFAAIASCKPSGGSFLGFPTWYKYLDGIRVPGKIGGAADACTPKITTLNDFWLVGAALIEILLRVAALGAIAIVIWGGIKFMVAQGEPDRIANARSIILDGLTGLVIAIAATAVINFVATRF